MYSTEPSFPYAEGYYAIFPRGLESGKVGNGSIVIEKEYIIYFKANTPQEIKDRLAKDYANYYAQKKHQEFFSKTCLRVVQIYKILTLNRPKGRFLYLKLNR